MVNQSVSQSVSDEDRYRAARTAKKTPCTMQDHAIPYETMLHCIATIPCYTIHFHIIPKDTIGYHSIPNNMQN